MTDDLAMVIAAHAAAQEDPMTRFIRSLPDDMRTHAEDTRRLREELLSNVQRMLTATDTHEAMGYASWVSKHAGEVAFRWSMLVRSLTKWMQYQTEAVVYLVPPHPTNEKKEHGTWSVSTSRFAGRTRRSTGTRRRSPATSPKG